MFCCLELVSCRLAVATNCRLELQPVVTNIPKCDNFCSVDSLKKGIPVTAEHAKVSRYETAVIWSKITNIIFRKIHAYFQYVCNICTLFKVDCLKTVEGKGIGSIRGVFGPIFLTVQLHTHKSLLIFQNLALCTVYLNRNQCDFVYVS